jgi:hypothetical protein
VIKKPRERGGHSLHWVAEPEIIIIIIKVKVPSNRLESPEGGRGIALYHLDVGARRGGWSAPRPGRFTPEKDPVPILQEDELIFLAIIKYLSL